MRTRYGVAIILSAFLLFQVQPLLGHFILPWFGGASSVWTSCLLFFQVLLVVGYLYAHLLSRLALRRQILVHVILLLLSLALLPITPSDTWKPGGGDDPVLRILILLTVAVGGPYLLLSTTGPLMQSWFSQETGGRSPYRLFALSNAASLLGLLAYPLLVQPRLEREPQTIWWSWGYAGFVLVCAWCGWRLWKSVSRGGSVGNAPVPDTPSTDPGSRFHPMWLALPACAVVLLLGITNTVTTEMAAVPFLWVLPLVLYLATFILSFDRAVWYSRRVFTPLLILFLIANTFLFSLVVSPGWLVQIVVASGTLFVCGMVCHGELARLKPPPRRLTGFYLSVSLGGALGGVFVAVISPLIFPGFWEVSLGLLACLLLYLTVLYQNPNTWMRRGQNMKWVAIGVGLIGPALMGAPLLALWNYDIEERTFYGVLQISDKDPGTPTARRFMSHGNTIHGMQYLSEERKDWPTSYYGPGSGAALALTHHPRRSASSLRLGIIGLGAGSLASLAREGDRVRFYEIDPKVLELAREYFTYLEACRGSVEVSLGDGRISLERDLEKDKEPYDVFMVDAFSEGSVPFHLLTRECFELYDRALAEDGILVLHVSNKYLRLAGVVRGAAATLGKRAAQVFSPGNPERGLINSHWILVADPANPIWQAPAVEAGIQPWEAGEEPLVWTDRFSSLLQVLR